MQAGALLQPSAQQYERQAVKPGGSTAASGRMKGAIALSASDSVLRNKNRPFARRSFSGDNIVATASLRWWWCVFGLLWAAQSCACLLGCNARLYAPSLRPTSV